MADGNAAGISPESLPAPWPDDGPDSLPPALFNYEAEQGLLGQLLYQNTAYERVADIVKAEHFADPAHRSIFEAIETYIDQGRQANSITLKPYFENDPSLRHVDGWKYLVRLEASLVAVVNAEEYARTIFECWCRRRLHALGTAMIAEATALKLDRGPAEIVASAESTLWELAQQDTRASSAQPDPVDVGIDHYLEQADMAHKANGALIGVTTGIKAMDDRTGGLHPSDLVVLAARPAQGKTALALNIARAAAEAEQAAALAEERAARRVLVFSLEMDSAQLAGRLLADRTGIPTDRVRRGQLKDTEFGILVQASTWLKSLPLMIDPTAGITTAQMRSRARSIQRRRGLALIVVDYLQLVEGEGENRTNVIAKITRDLKVMAKELDVPVLALSQLSREVEKREDKRPMLADLRDSGSIEQDADAIWFIFRHEQYLKNEEPRSKTGESSDKFAQRVADWEAAMAAASGKAEVIIAKNRHGAEGVAHLKFIGIRQRFYDPNEVENRQPDMLGDTDMAEERGR